MVARAPGDAVSLPGVSGTAPSGPAHNGPAPGALAPGRAGMVVSVDPETGELRAPAPQQFRQLREASGPHVALAPLRETRNPDGSYSMTLDDRFTQYSVARVAGDGTVREGCV